MTAKSRHRADRREQRKADAQRKARSRARRRLAVRFGAIGAAALAIALGAAWWLGGSNGQEATASQALHRFTTTDFHSLVFAPDDPETIYFGHHFGLQVSRDGGASWREGTLGRHDAMYQAIPLADPSRHYVAGHDVFQLSADGGETWQQPATTLPALDIHGFAAAPSDANRLYAFEIVSRALYTSANGGTTWNPVVLPPGMSSGILPLAVSFDDPLHVFAGVSDQVMESRDGGRSWQSIAGPGGAIVSIATSSEEATTLYAGTGQGLWQLNRGAGWVRLPVATDGSVLAIAVHPRHPNIIAILDQQGHFYRSDDGGQTWE